MKELNARLSDMVSRWIEDVEREIAEVQKQLKDTPSLSGDAAYSYMMHVEACQKLLGQLSQYQEADAVTVKSQPQTPEGKSGSPYEFPSPIPKLALSRTEAAKALGVSLITIDRLVKRRLLRPSMAVRKPLFTLKEIERFLSETSQY